MAFCLKIRSCDIISLKTIWADRVKMQGLNRNERPGLLEKALQTLLMVYYSFAKRLNYRANWHFQETHQMLYAIK
jgi:hypothetical protein